MTTRHGPSIHPGALPRPARKARFRRCRARQPQGFGIRQRSPRCAGDVRPARAQLHRRALACSADLHRPSRHSRGRGRACVLDDPRARTRSGRAVGPSDPERAAADGPQPPELGLLARVSRDVAQGASASSSRSSSSAPAWVTRKLPPRSARVAVTPAAVGRAVRRTSPAFASTTELSGIACSDAIATGVAAPGRRTRTAPLVARTTTVFRKHRHDRGDHRRRHRRRDGDRRDKRRSVERGAASPAPRIDGSRASRRPHCPRRPFRERRTCSHRRRPAIDGRRAAALEDAARQPWPVEAALHSRVRFRRGKRDRDRAISESVGRARVDRRTPVRRCPR